nr:MAG TPA: hypothetical protein [Crassvirales sp.]
MIIRTYPKNRSNTSFSLCFNVSNFSIDYPIPI